MLAKADFATMVPIRNMDRAIRFYTDRLSGSLNMRAEGAMKDSWASVSVGKIEFWLIKPEKREKGELAYSTFVVKDIKETVSGLRKKKGLKFLRAERSRPESKTDGPITYSPYGASAFFKDSEDNLLMLWESVNQQD